jgi:membrane protein implicated in regulation of membrane protease activity
LAVFLAAAAGFLAAASALAAAGFLAAVLAATAGAAAAAGSSDVSFGSAAASLLAFVGLAFCGLPLALPFTSSSSSTTAPAFLV